jgi:hypothetical protein
MNTALLGMRNITATAMIPFFYNFSRSSGGAIYIYICNFLGIPIGNILFNFNSVVILWKRTIKIVYW